MSRVSKNTEDDDDEIITNKGMLTISQGFYGKTATSAVCTLLRTELRPAPPTVHIYTWNPNAPM